jgi:hypothetical protein
MDFTLMQNTLTSNNLVRACYTVQLSWIQFSCLVCVRFEIFFHDVPWDKPRTL